MSTNEYPMEEKDCLGPLKSYKDFCKTTKYPYNKKVHSLYTDELYKQYVKDVANGFHVAIEMLPQRVVEEIDAIRTASAALNALKTMGII